MPDRPLPALDRQQPPELPQGPLWEKRLGETHVVVFCLHRDPQGPYNYAPDSSGSCGGAQKPIAVTPRSSQELAAGFNAGMFVFQPSRVTYQQIMDKFLAMREEDMFATTEQDFLNKHFAHRYNLIPIDYLMKVVPLPSLLPTPHSAVCPG